MLAPRLIGQPMKVFRRSRQPLAVSLGAMLLDVLIRIEPALKFDNPDFEPFAQQHRDSFRRRPNPRRVRIEVHIDRVRVPLHRPRLRIDQRCSATGHHLMNPAAHVHADYVHVALDQNHMTQFADRFLRPVQVVQHIALLIDGRLRRIQVLRLVLIG